MSTNDSTTVEVKNDTHPNHVSYPEDYVAGSRDDLYQHLLDTKPNLLEWAKNVPESDVVATTLLFSDKTNFEKRELANGSILSMYLEDMCKCPLISSDRDLHEYSLLKSGAMKEIVVSHVKNAKHLSITAEFSGKCFYYLELGQGTVFDHSAVVLPPTPWYKNPFTKRYSTIEPRNVDTVTISLSEWIDLGVLFPFDRLVVQVRADSVGDVSYKMDRVVKTNKPISYLSDAISTVVYS